jgi:hypothetical protein
MVLFFCLKITEKDYFLIFQSHGTVVILLFLKKICTDNFQTIFHDFCTAFVCVSEIKKKKTIENFDCRDQSVFYK